MTETIHIWSGEAELYADVRPAPPSILLDICTQLIHTPHPTLVVDFGSGTGLSTVFWARRVQQVIGIEPNADMRSQAMQRLSLIQSKCNTRMDFPRRLDCHLKVPIS